MNTQKFFNTLVAVFLLVLSFFLLIQQRDNKQLLTVLQEKGNSCGCCPETQQSQLLPEFSTETSTPFPQNSEERISSTETNQNFPTTTSTKSVVEFTPTSVVRPTKTPVKVNTSTPQNNPTATLIEVIPTNTPNPTETDVPTRVPTNIPDNTPGPHPTELHCNNGEGNGGEGCSPSDNGNNDEDDNSNHHHNNHKKHDNKKSTWNWEFAFTYNLGGNW